MPSESPEGRQSRLANNAMIGLYDLLGSAVNEEVDVEYTSCCNVAKSAGPIVVEPEERGLSVRVLEEDTKKVAWCLALYQNKGMYAIDSFSSDTIIVGTVLAFCPHTPSSR